MTTLGLWTCLALSTVGCDPVDSSSALPQIVRSSHGSQAKELRTSVSEALRSQALAKGDDRGPALRRLVDVYKEVEGSEAVGPVERKSLLANMRSRLTRVALDIHRSNQKSAKSAQPKNVAPREEQAILAQIPGAAGAGAAPAPGMGGGGAGPGFGGGPSDYGPELMELIYATISPSTWDVNGGLGSMYYYAPLGVLVTSQTP